MRTRIGALVLAVAAGLAGCNTAPAEECASQQLPVINAQGAEYRCTASEDCPRSSGVPLCVSDTGNLEACVRCIETRCYTVTPEAC
ncbi:hypothetical protein [Archangium sp.]|uniref:hypothetical protein n=1 Tax=Archangium sp. TaxID=1872627 RepID=UPI003899A9FB